MRISVRDRASVNVFITKIIVNKVTGVVWGKSIQVHVANIPYHPLLYDSAESDLSSGPSCFRQTLVKVYLSMSHKNVPNLGSCSFVKYGPMFVIFDTYNQYTLENGVLVHSPLLIYLTSKIQRRKYDNLCSCKTAHLHTTLVKQSSSSIKNVCVVVIVQYWQRWCTERLLHFRLHSVLTQECQSGSRHVCSASCGKPVSCYNWFRCSAC